MSSTGALSLERVPDHMVLIGGGVIGLELVRTFLLPLILCFYFVSVVSKPVVIKNVPIAIFGMLLEFRSVC